MENSASTPTFASTSTSESQDQNKIQLNQNSKSPSSINTPSWPDSWCVTHWQMPDLELIVWKKSTLDQSLENLAEIRDFLNQESLWQKCYLEVSKQKIAQSLEKTGNFRVGDYVYLVDLEAGKVLVENKNGQQVLLGGGREAGEDGLESLQREVSEESSGYIQLESSKCLKIAEFVKKMKLVSNQEKFDGKHLNMYFYPLKMTELDLESLNKNLAINFSTSANLPNKGELHSENNLPKSSPVFLEWVDLTDFIKQNSFINWPVWHNFCLENKLFCPSLPLETWHQQTLLSFWRTGQLELWALESTTFWETQIKNWLTENNKKTGDYLWPLRVALSGQKQSPSPFELLACLSHAQVQEKLSQVLDSAPKN